MQVFKTIKLILAVILGVSASYLALQNRAIAQDILSAPIIPNFWDTNVTLVKPEDLRLNRLRFLTTTDFPPFNFIDRNKRLSGFHIDLAREICSELDLLPLCQIQALPWSELDKAMLSGDGEAIIAGLGVSQELKQKYDFSSSFLQIPGRFVALKSSGFVEPMANVLQSKTVGVVKGSAHARYIEEIFLNTSISHYDTLALAKKALVEGKVDVLFSDAVSLVFWLPSKSANNCCKLVGGPYVSQQYFGNGLTIAVAKGNPNLIEAINFALRRIYIKGKYRELYQRYFPISLY